MVESFANELSGQKDRGEQRDLNKFDNEGSLKCLLEVFTVPCPKSSENLAGAAGDKPQPIKDVPGGKLAAQDNQFYLDYRGLHLPTFTGKKPDGTDADPFSGEDAKARVDGKLQALSDGKGNVLGVDGSPLLDSMGMRRFNEKGAPVFTQYDASEPAQMQKALESQSKAPLNDESRRSYNKMIESSDKLDRVDMARKIEADEKYVMSHTTAFLWETAYRQLQQQPGSEEALKGRDAELKQKPVLAEQVRRVREGAATDEEMGQLLSSSVDTRAAYMSRLLSEDSVKQYMSGKDRRLENDANVGEARRVVAELAKLDPSLIERLQPTAKLLGLRDLRSKEK